MKLSKQGWAVAMLGMGSVEALEDMQEQVAPIVGHTLQLLQKSRKNC